MGDHDKGAELPNGVSGHLLAEENGERLGVVWTDDLCGKNFNVQDGENQSRGSSTKLFEPMWTLFFELHTGPVAQAAIRGLTHDR
jgi:hypothetical protein